MAGADEEAEQAANLAALAFHKPAGLTSLLSRNQILNLLTLRLFRFWARTHLRQALWSAVIIEGEPLEYSGKGHELFQGFLVIFTVMVPLMIALGIVLDLLAGNSAAATAVYNMYWAVLLFGFAAGSYQARRYQLSRTLWRGIHAGQNGSAWHYGLRFLGWVLVFCLTAGLSVPWACMDLAHYRMRHTNWGSFRGSFTGNGFDLVPAWLLTWLLSVGPLFTYAVYMLQQSEWNVGVFYVEIAGLLTLLMQADGIYAFCFYLSFFLVGLLNYFVFQVRKWCWLIEHSAIGPMRLRCHIRTGDLLRSIDKGALAAAICAFGAAITINRIGVDDTLSGLPFALKIWAVLALVMVAWSAFSFIGMALIYVPALEMLVCKTTIENISAANEARQGRFFRPRYGEGVADVCTTTFT